MSAISVRLPASLHEAVRELAAKENVSINHLITLALAESCSRKAETLSSDRSEGQALGSA